MAKHAAKLPTQILHKDIRQQHFSELMRLLIRGAIEGNWKESTHKRLPTVCKLSVFKAENKFHYA